MAQFTDKDRVFLAKLHARIAERVAERENCRRCNFLLIKEDFFHGDEVLCRFCRNQPLPKVGIPGC